MCPRVVVLADDLTGALEVGGRLAAYCEHVIVSLDDVLESAEVLVIDAETRHVPESEAASRVHAIARAAREAGAQFLYKKTDSTLRGHIGAELDAVLRAWPESPMLYAPAYPEMGRSVRDGVLYLDGRPVAETEFARDRLNPARESSIARLLERWATHDRVVLHEGEAAEVIAGFRLAAGPAPVATAVAQLLFTSRIERSLPGASRCVVVNGSRHPRSMEQMKHAVEAGFPAIDYNGADKSAVEVAADLARRAVACDWDALIVFGGDTAVAVLRALGETRVRPIAEVLPGVPVSRIGDRLLITKAGGFGPVDILLQLRTSLSR